MHRATHGGMSYPEASPSPKQPAAAAGLDFGLTVLHGQHESDRVCCGACAARAVWRWPSRGACAARAALAIAALALLAPGCHWPRPRPRKPNLYEVRGRVVDADTGQGVADVRVRLRATIAGPAGAQHLTSYAVTQSDGTYRAELSAGFDLVRRATEIRLDASKQGYIAGGADLAPPAKERDYYKAPAIVVQPGRSPPPPPDLEGLGVPLTEPPRPNPLPWKR